ncbi:hypothetical protein K470DRAFT_20664 [Piedraia hortae CBS 480.64]|uniref:Uncharacterized protein n=1 Tax=Piedraia hortae CBS 480.64 TaxID=1314780 RepID=A0A6A7C3S3_9PEZI|nr:hypothetical protein K470DRAFT_20664 [Piedraia hortae CBS 480.64]
MAPKKRQSLAWDRHAEQNISKSSPTFDFQNGSKAPRNEYGLLTPDSGNSNKKRRSFQPTVDDDIPDYETPPSSAQLSSQAATFEEAVFSSDEEDMPANETAQEKTIRLLSHPSNRQSQRPRPSRPKTSRTSSSVVPSTRCAIASTNSPYSNMALTGPPTQQTHSKPSSLLRPVTPNPKSTPQSGISTTSAWAAFPTGTTPMSRIHGSTSSGTASLDRASPLT